MDFDKVVSLLGLLLTAMSVAIDLVALVIRGKMRKRPNKRPPLKKL